MNEEKFDNYSFSINTEGLIDGRWLKVVEVDFRTRYIGFENGYYLSYKKVSDLKN